MRAPHSPPARICTLVVVVGRTLRAHAHCVILYGRQADTRRENQQQQLSHVDTAVGY
jgi:hypothetical protein